MAGRFQVNVVPSFCSRLVGQKVGIGQNAVAGVDLGGCKNGSGPVAVDIGEQPAVVYFHLLVLVLGRACDQTQDGGGCHDRVSFENSKLRMCEAISLRCEARRGCDCTPGALVIQAETSPRLYLLFKQWYNYVMFTSSIVW